ncbi:hypothetical protein H8356DRAFT_1053423 [Neocallimastix lanati (nom. inval.)]|uniref:Uncharacterized protein n=1 Tax=Neocallimastix californiae TaxID=1754190 RepID=A0A1Y2AAX5_9FUNG|nr:hypothetical protein H8356DRAFT_1053423 [Neocallimastix sp. JGI-2020a]ORY19634.1 hypothetical protein LY90DRAFT_708135 [Neocallimastix californiae]|eukprot:ORY19634.1 hypothetical protein LY90DRAFT_708135 [Neocallimastix californiae]
MENVLKEQMMRERLAEDIMVDKQLVVDLDRKRNQNREALGKLRKDKNLKNESKAWIILDDMFIKLPKDTIEKNIKSDQEKLDKEINSLRDSIRDRAVELGGIENINGKDNRKIEAFKLKGMSSKEVNKYVNDHSRVYRI